MDSKGENRTALCRTEIERDGEVFAIKILSVRRGI